MPVLHCTAHDGTPVCIASPDLTETASGFCEQRSYVLSVGHPDACKLVLDEVELQPSVPGQKNAWHWQPGFYAGTVLAELCGPTGHVLAQYRLDVSPDPQKLGQDEFQCMLDQIFSFEPGLLTGSEAAQFGIGAEGEITDVNLEYARLRRYGKQLRCALKSLTSHPIKQLHNDRALVPANQVRRLDSQSMMAIAKQPVTIARLRGVASAAAVQSEILFDVPRSREILDTPAHRTLLRVVKAVLLRIQYVSEALANWARTEEQSTTRTALGPRMARRHAYLTELETELKRALRLTPFNEVSRQEISAAGLNAIAAHPLYSRVFRTCWSILRPGIAGNSDELLWMSPTWQIYERWCFLRVYEALCSVFPELAWQRYFPTKRDDCIVFKAEQGDLKIALYLQPRFPAFDQPAWESFQSLSGERIPDIVLTYSKGCVKQMLVFDAKYRVSRAGVLDAMQSAHTYHDCLRWVDTAPALSLLFVPAGGGAKALEEKSYRDKYGVGVLPASVGIPLGALSQLLEMNNPQ